jgi:hypothetical protein
VVYSRTVFKCILVLLLAASVAEAQSRDTRTWYQAYADAQQNIARRNWQGALNDLDAAERLNPPRPGRNINFYGDVYRDYNPDYYRGVALTNLKRFEEADQAFERVRQAQLIGPRDPLNTEFNLLSKNVKDAMGALAAERNRTAPPVQPPPDTTIATNLPAAPNAAPVRPTEDNAPAAAPAPGNPPAPSPVPGSTVAVETRPVTPSQTGETQAAAAKALEADRRNQNTLNLGVIGRDRRSAPALNAEREAIVRYFSGDYAAAYEGLRGVANTDAATPRTYLYFACAQAALVLTGRSQPLLMAEARALVPRIGDPTALARDLALISPRIRAELGLQP